MKTDTKTKRKRLCKACDGEFFPMHGNQGYCSNVCRGAPSLHRFIGRDGRCYIANAGAERKRICRACGSEFFWVNSNQVYWSEVCRRVPAPAVYRFIAPDGRSYVGSRANWLAPKRDGITPTNSRLVEALAEYPADTWTFEVLQILPGRCLEADRHRDERYHIDRLRSWDPTHGFNMNPADHSVASTACKGAYRAEVGKTVRTLRDWRRRGVGPSFARFGRTVRYNRVTLAEYFKSQEVQPVRRRHPREGPPPARDPDNRAWQDTLVRKGK